jgi:hypothetical protein
MLKENHLSDLEKAIADYKRRLEEAEARVVLLENRLREVSAPVPPGNSPSSGKTVLRDDPSPGAGMTRVYSLKNSAQNMVNELLTPGTGASGGRDTVEGEDK